MGIETPDYIDDLNIDWPLSEDPPLGGDNHLRNIKKAVKQSFPAITGAVTSTQTELNLLDGVTSTTAELNILDGVTADKDEINVLDGVTAGTVTASKALVVDASKDLATINAMTVTDLTATSLNASSVLADGVTATTQAVGDDSTKPATTAFVKNIVQGYLLYEDQKAAGTHGGGFVKDIWQKRTLAEQSDENSYGTVSSSVITLEAGTYIVSGSAPALQVSRHQTRLRNTTSNTTLLVGSSEDAPAAVGSTSRSTIAGLITVAASQNLELQHHCNSTHANDGFGIAADFGEVEVYARVEFWRVD